MAPAPADDLVQLLANVPIAVSVEAHYVVGGLGSLVAEVIAEHGLKCRLIRCGPRDIPRLSGSQQYLYGIHGLTPSSLAQRAQSAIDIGSIS